MVDWGGLVQHGGEVVGTGVASFFGSLFRLSQRVSSIEKQLASILKHPEGPISVTFWRIENFDRWTSWFQQELQRLEQMHHQKLEVEKVKDELEKEMRASSPDPMEEVYRRLKQLEADIGKLRERGSRYVRSDVFSEYVREQEVSWRTISESLGRLNKSVELLEKKNQ